MGPHHPWSPIGSDLLELLVRWNGVLPLGEIPLLVKVSAENKFGPAVQGISETARQP